VKPLLYHLGDDKLTFGSSSWALADAFGLAPNLDYVARGTRFRIYEDESSATAFAGLSAVEPGTFVEVMPGPDGLAIRTRRYYDFEAAVLREADTIAESDETGLMDKLEGVLLNATEIRLRSDVPIGISLSGGIDSCLIACLCAKLGVKPEAFSFGDPDDAESEAPFVESLSRRLGLKLELIALRNRSELEETFWRTLVAQEAPFAGMSVLAQNAVFMRARDEGIRVLLGGQGGDEAFMGYSKYFLFYTEHVWRRHAWTELPQLLMSLGLLPLGLLPRARVLWRDRGRYRSSGGVESKSRLPLGDEMLSLGLGCNMTLLQRQVLDITRLSLPTLLRYEDRNSGGSSIETRLPLMDHRVMEFGVALPLTYKLRRGQGKWLLRSLLARYAPASIAWNPVKRGFDVNERRWMSLGLGQILRNAIEAYRPVLSHLLSDGLDVDCAFSDARLLKTHSAFAEAVSLIWVARHIQGEREVSSGNKVIEERGSATMPAHLA
jgi:asparagine synthase (glutamine-hydrolysing)